ncbi:hypothetical protein Tco_0172625 [Tanacetum coccineum]
MEIIPQTLPNHPLLPARAGKNHDTARVHRMGLHASYVEIFEKKGPVKLKAAPVKPKPDVKQSVAKRKRSVDDVVSDVLNDLNDSKVVKRKKSVEEDDFVGSDENVKSDERDDESDEDDEANQTEEESNKDEERKTTKGKKKDVTSEFDNESKDEMVKKRGKKTKSNSESEAEMVKKRSKKTKVALKSKKREPVSEDKVLKVKKKFKKKKKHVSYSSSSFEEEKPIIKKKKLDAKKKKKKPMTLAQIKKEKYLSRFPPLCSRIVPCSLFAAIHNSQVDLKSFLSDIGFSSLHNVFIDTLPSRFSRFVVTTFTTSNYEFKLEKGVIRVTPEKVHEILGILLGGTSIFDLLERPLDDDFVNMWFNQFNPKPFKDIHASDISEKLVFSKKVDFMFKVNFLMLFANVMGTADKLKAIVNLTVLRRIRKDTNIAKVDWCGFIHSCLKQSAGVCSLIEEKLKFISDEKAELEDILRKANTQFMNDEGIRVLYEKYVGVFKETMLFEEKQVHVDDFHPGDGEKFGTDVAGEKHTAFEAEDVNEEVVNEVEEDKFEEETFTQWIKGNIEWFGEVIDCLYDGYYEEDLFVWPSKVPVDVHRPETIEGRVTRSSPQKRISKPSAYLSSPYMNNKMVVIAQVKRLEFVLGIVCLRCRAILLSGNSLFPWESVFQTSTGPDVSSIRLNMETLAPTLWIDANVTQAMIEGRITEKQQWKMFSAEISAQFQNNLAGKSLSEVELKKCFSRYLCENNHPLHEKVAKVKPRIPKLKWSTTKNHVDCGVFLMIHMKSYIGEPTARWNVGLCTESHTQDSLLRRMRYKLAAKILLHELNIHSQKVFDLAYKFETENDKHTRISIIVNAIKNRAEHDPALNSVKE